MEAPNEINEKFFVEEFLSYDFFVFE